MKTTGSNDGSDINVSKSLTKNNFKANKNGNTVTALNIGVYNVSRNYPVAVEMVNHRGCRIKKTIKKQSTKHIKSLQIR